MQENSLPADAVQPENERELPDHRRIGRALGLFHQQDDASGSVFWHPNGFTLYRTIEGYIRDRLRLEGYDEIRTPQLYDRSLFVASGHWENYRKDMFRCSSADETVESREFALKPMNCPGHVQIFNAQTVTYRQLPMRLSEFGCCHRNEASGALNGLMRVRQFTQDDAHIFCTPEQVLAETKAFCALVMSVYEDFGFTNVEIGFSTRPEKRAGSDETWDRAEAALAAAVTDAGYGYTMQPGEGAFYGPKLEFTLTDARGRSWQCGTLQLDFVLPESLDATYESAHDGKQRPVMLHRAILGSFERFIAILLEETEGRLPPWLAPVQFVVLPIKPEHAEYAVRVEHQLRTAGLRGKVDARDENLKARIKDHSVARVPFVLVVGGREAEQQTVAVRDQSGTNTILSVSDAAGALLQHCARPSLGDSRL